LKKILDFFLTKIVLGLAMVIGLVALVEWAGRGLLDKTDWADGTKNIIIAVLESALAISGYIFLYSNYEKRKITEFSATGFIKNSVAGFSTGLLLQSLFVLVIALGSRYWISATNPFENVINGLANALTAGFVAEIIFRGIIFRLLEEALGSMIALLCMLVLFIIAHWNVDGADFISISATSVQAGLVLSAAYMATRSLWFTIFLHFAWDFAEPSIFGAINPGMSNNGSLFSSIITGPRLLTGGPMGPQNSLQALIICLLTTVIFLWIALRKSKFVQGNLFKH